MASCLRAAVFLAILLLVSGYVENSPEFDKAESRYYDNANLMTDAMIMPSTWLSINPSLASTSVFLSLSCLVHSMQSFIRIHKSEMVSMCVLHWPSLGLLAMIHCVDGYTQSQPKLVGSGASGNAAQGSSTGVSGDGLTACVGETTDNNYIGAVWIYTRVEAGNFTWVQHGLKIVPNDSTYGCCGVYFGCSCSLSFDGNTAVVGGYEDNNTIGATWIITRDGSGVWAQQGAKRVGTGYVIGASPNNHIRQGWSTSLASIAVNVYVSGGFYDNYHVGSAWVFSFSGGAWSQVGNKLVGSGGSSNAYQGRGVAISADAITIAVGGYGDANVGSVWIFTLSGSSYLQQGGKFTANPATSSFGSSVALSANGATLVVGATGDIPIGAMYAFTRSVAGVWSQQGGKNVGTNNVGAFILQGMSVAISANGNIAAIGGPFDNNTIGATWIFTRNSSNIWTQYGPKLVGSGYTGTSINQGATNSVSLSANGSILFVGGYTNNSGVIASWAFNDTGIFGLTDFTLARAEPCTRPTNSPTTLYNYCFSPIPNGTVCTPTCSTGFTPTNSLSILCVNGTLSSSEGICSPSPCISLPSLSAGMTSGNCYMPVSSLSSCTLGCDNTHSPSGTLSVACSHGTWSTITGTCDTNCPNLPSLPNIVPNTCYPNYPSGSVCSLSCMSGFAASGSLGTQCTSGSWSIITGVCIECGNKCSASTKPTTLSPGSLVLTSFSVAILILGFVPFFFLWLRRKCAAKPQDHKDESHRIFIAALALADFFSDLSVLINTSYNNQNGDKNNFILALTVFLVVPVLANAISVGRLMRKYIVDAPHAKEWLRDNMLAASVVSFLSLFNSETILLMSSNVFHSKWFGAPRPSQHFIDSVELSGMLTIVFEDVPQVVIQLILAKQAGTFSVLIAVSVMFSIVTVGISMARRFLVYILNKSDNSYDKNKKQQALTSMKEELLSE